MNIYTILQEKEDFNTYIESRIKEFENEFKRFDLTERELKLIKLSFMRGYQESTNKTFKDFKKEGLE